MLAAKVAALLRTDTVSKQPLEVFVPCVRQGGCDAGGAVCQLQLACRTPRGKTGQPLQLLAAVHVVVAAV